MRYAAILTLLVFSMLLPGCDDEEKGTRAERKATERQMQQYATAQPAPAFDWSYERHLLIQLYKLRNQKVATHTVWRGAMSQIEGDCPSLGFPIPYTTSLTSPDQPSSNYGGNALTTVAMAEPNGLYPSYSTKATWVMCAGEGGMLEPVYVEGDVTAYPHPVNVDYGTNRVTKSGSATFRVSPDR